MRKKALERTLARAFAEFAAEFPVAKGSLTKTHSPCVRKGCRLCAEGAGHPKLIFTFRENGRAVERLLAEAGRDLVLGWRSRDDAE